MLYYICKLLYYLAKSAQVPWTFFQLYVYYMIILFIPKGWYTWKMCQNLLIRLIIYVLMFLEKTKYLLFAGAKKPNSLKKLSVEIDQPPKPLPGQLRLDVDGHICNKRAIPMDGGFGTGVNGGDFRYVLRHDTI